MRIGMILDKSFPPDPRVENEAISLIKNNFEVYLFCLTYGNEPLYEIRNGIHVYRYHSNRLTYKLSALAYSLPGYTLLMATKILDFLTKNDIQVLHVHDIQIAAAVFRANRKRKLDIVLDLHENRPEIMKYYTHVRSFPGNFLISAQKWKRKEEEFIRKSSRVVVVTDEAKQEIIERTAVEADKVITVPNTVAKDFGQTPDEDLDAKIGSRYRDHYVMLYIGDTGERRGLSTAIRGLVKLKDKIGNIKLVIVGKSTNDAYLKKLVNYLKINELVDFQGWQDEQTFPSYIKASHICLSPLHRNLHHDTTYANKLFQYMSLGKPILVSDVIAQKNIVEQHHVGLIHEAENVADFNRQVKRLYRNKEEAHAFGKNGKVFVNKEFNWEKTSENLIDLYRNMS